MRCSRIRRIAALPVAVLAMASGCSSSHRSRSAVATTTTTILRCTSRPDQAGPPPEFLITAINTTYDRTCLQAAVGRVVLVFNNRDAGVGHSLTVVDPAGTQVITSHVLTGPRVFSLSFQVGPGTYHYHCDVHPQQMAGVLVAK